MADANCTSTLTNILPYIGTLSGVAVGAVLSWLLQRNEWGRQKQWELKREAVLDAVRALADLEYALIRLNTAFVVLKEGQTSKKESECNDAAQHFRESRTSFRCAHIIADLAIGGQFSNALSAYFLLIGGVSKDIKQRKRFLDREKFTDLTLCNKNVIQSARQALEIKDAGELPAIDESN